MTARSNMVISPGVVDSAYLSKIFDSEPVIATKLLIGVTSVPKSTAKGLTRAASPLSLIFGKACHAHTREHLFREGSLMTCTRGLTTIPNGSPQNLRALLLKLSSTHSCFPDLTADCCRSESSRISVIGWLGRWSTVNRKMAIFAQPS